MSLILYQKHHPKFIAAGIILDELEALIGIENITLYRSYNVNINEMYDHFIDNKDMCECSYELQCAVFDISEMVYNINADNHFLNKFERVDREMILFEPSKYPLLFENENKILDQMKG